MVLAEYLYVDQHRLDSYFEQISSPVRYDKVPIWNVHLSLAGPSAGGSQARIGRPFTTHEKIQSVRQFLREKRMIFNGRPGDGDDALFCLETCTATPVSIPPQAENARQSDGLALWVSLVEGTEETAIRRARVRGTRLLYLLEDSHGDSFEVFRLSAYSMLKALLDGHSAEFANTILGNRAEEIQARSEGMPFASTPSDLIKRLVRWGAQVGDQRCVEVLYRVRTVFAESFSRSGSKWSVFGYPIYVAEAAGRRGLVL